MYHSTGFYYVAEEKEKIMLKLFKWCTSHFRNILSGFCCQCITNVNLILNPNIAGADISKIYLEYGFSSHVGSYGCYLYQSMYLHCVSSTQSKLKLTVYLLC